MTKDQYLWACALEVETQHGDRAVDHCLAQIVRLEQGRDVAGVRTWQAIMKRLEALGHGI